MPNEHWQRALSAVASLGFAFFLLTNVLIVSRFGYKHLLNALNVNLNGTA